MPSPRQRERDLIAEFGRRGARGFVPPTRAEQPNSEPAERARAELAERLPFEGDCGQYRTYVYDTSISTSTATAANTHTPAAVWREFMRSAETVNFPQQSARLAERHAWEDLHAVVRWDSSGDTILTHSADQLRIGPGTHILLTPVTLKRDGKSLTKPLNQFGYITFDEMETLGISAEHMTYDQGVTIDHDGERYVFKKEA